MANLALFAIDETKENDGIWFNFGEDIEILVASIEKKAFQKARRKAENKKAATKGRRASKNEQNKTGREIIVEIAADIAQHICLGWKNIELPIDKEGNINLEQKKNKEFLNPVVEFPYNKANAEILLSDYAFRELTLFIYEKAAEVEDFYLEVAETDAKE